MARGKRNYGKLKRDNPAKNMPRKVKQELEQEKRIRRVEEKVVKINKSPELKYKDTAWTDPDVTGELILLNNVDQGTDQTDRIGAQITMKSLLIHISVITLPAVIVGVTYRLMVVLDRQANGAAPPISGNPTVGLAGILNTETIVTLEHAPRQYETIKRFKILFDKTYSLNPNLTLETNATNAATTMPYSRSISEYIKLGQVTKYDGSENDIADINTNSLYILHMTSDTNTVGIVGGSRLYFTDT